jgi:hypothetical protein
MWNGVNSPGDFKLGVASMSSVHSYAKPIRDAERKHPETGFILTLVCLALGLVVASLMFTPKAIGSGMNSGESWFVGP